MRTAIVAMLAAIAVVRPASGQESWDAQQARVSRPALESLLARYEAAAESPAYTEVLRAEARDQANLIRRRLAEGDFRPGDRLLVDVEGQTQLTDTFAVAANQQVTLPTVGVVELRGVLRSEVQQHIDTAVAQFIRDPRVTTRSLVRIQIDGAVGSPGYYLVDSDMPVAELIMLAGGQANEARLTATRIDRGEETIVSAERFQQALRAGATVDHIGLRDGDRMYVPGSRTDWLTTARDIVYIVPAALGVIALLM